MSQSNTAASQNPVAANAAARANLLAYGARYVRKLQSVNATSGLIQIPLDRVGITTGISLHVSATINNTGAGALVPSILGPFNLLQNISYTDFGGTQHTVNLNGAQLEIHNAAREGRIPYLSPSLQLPGLGSSISGLVETGGAVGNSTLQFFLDLPLAIHEDVDLTGAVLSQTGQGNHYVQAQIAASLIGADAVLSPFASGTATLTNVQITAYQRYLMPPAFTSQFIPSLDLTTVYGYQTEQDLTTIATGADHYCYWPNARNILSALHVFDNGGVLNPGSDLNYVKLFANSNTLMKEYSPPMFLANQRKVFGADLFPGFYYLGNRRQPIVVNQIGQVATIFNPSAASAGSSFYNSYEVTYPSGAALPGIVA